MTAAGESQMWTEFFLSPAMAREPATVCVQQDRLVSDPLHDAWYYRHLPVYYRWKQTFAKFKTLC